MRSVCLTYKRRQTFMCYMNVGRLSADSHSTLFIFFTFGINFSLKLCSGMLGLNQASGVAAGGTHKRTCTLDFMVELSLVSILHTSMHFDGGWGGYRAIYSSQFLLCSEI